MSLRQLAEQTLSQDAGTSGALATWRRRVSAAVDRFSRSETHMLYWTLSALPPAESPQGAPMIAGFADSLDDNDNQPTILIPPGDWIVLSAHVANFDPTGSATAGYTLTVYPDGDPLGVASLLSSSGARVDFVLAGDPSFTVGAGPAVSLGVQVTSDAADPPSPRSQVVAVVARLP